MLTITSHVKIVWPISTNNKIKERIKFQIPIPLKEKPLPNTSYIESLSIIIV